MSTYQSILIRLKGKIKYLDEASSENSYKIAIVMVQKCYFISTLQGYQ